MHVIEQSFAIFVLPFCFESSTFAARVAAVECDRLESGESPWPLWERRRFPKDDLLRHVADYLNPPPGVTPTAYLWTLSSQVLGSPRGLGLGRDMVGLWLHHRQCPATGQDEPETPGSGPLSLQVDAIDLALFGVGMGYLIFRTRLGSRQADDWLDFLNGFRFIDRPGQVDLLFSRRTGKDQVAPFFPPLAASSDRAAEGRGVVMHLVGGLLGRLAPDDGWWREVFVPGQMLPFFALRIGQVASDEQPRMLYRLRKFFRAKQALVPSADDLRPDHPALLHYAEQMWFSLTLEGGGFVAFDPPDTKFWTSTMVEHLKEQYFLLFLLALHQRCTLMTLSEQVCARWPREDQPGLIERFTQLRESLLEFTARGYFSQVMQRDNHHRCFRAWQRVFEVEQLYREVRDEVTDLHGMLMLRKTERIRQLGEEQRGYAERLNIWFGVVAVLLGLPSVALAFLQVIQETSWQVAGLSVLGTMALGGLLILLHRLWHGRQARRSD